MCVGDDIIVKKRRRNQTNTRGHVVKVRLEVFEMKIQFHFFSTILKNEYTVGSELISKICVMYTNVSAFFFLFKFSLNLKKKKSTFVVVDDV